MVRIGQKLGFSMMASDADQIRWIVRSDTNLMQSDKESLAIKGAKAQLGAEAQGKILAETISRRNNP